LPAAHRLLAALAGIASIILTIPIARAATEVYGDYSLMFQRSAGQYFADGAVAGQWAWSPQSGSESWVSWGDPAAWPPAYHETFIHEGDWVMLDGWTGNGTYYTLRVTNEQLCDASGGNCTTLATSGRQHYVRWTPTPGSYMLRAWGTITEQSSGRVVDFGHTQIWSGPGACSNPYLGAQTCIKQWESWWDNNGSPGAPITRKVERDQLIARGIGMAFTILQYYPSSWRADLRYNWSW
jgi:hypothetical protein